MTPSLPTLNALIEMVRSDNNRRQGIVDEHGAIVYRALDVGAVIPISLMLVINLCKIISQSEHHYAGV